MTRLTNLNLASNQITGLDVKASTELQACVELRNLDLSNNLIEDLSITDDGCPCTMVAFFALSTPLIRCLNITGNPCKAGSITDLSAGLPELVYFNERPYRRISDTGNNHIDPLRLAGISERRHRALERIKTQSQCMLTLDLGIDEPPMDEMLNDYRGRFTELPIPESTRDDSSLGDTEESTDSEVN